jgi:hypothetical protein
MRGFVIATLKLIVVELLLSSNSFVSKIKPRQSRFACHSVQKRQDSVVQADSLIDAKTIRDGSLVEYTSTKGTKRLAIVNKRVGAHLDVLNDARKSFSVPISRVTYHINGTFAFGDLLRLNEILGELKPIQVERLWELSFGQNNPAVCNLLYVSKQIFGSTDAVRTFASMKLMSTYGGVFFEQVARKEPISSISDGNSAVEKSSVTSIPDTVYVPLPPNIVQQNLRSRAALKEFKQRFMKVNIALNNMLSYANFAIFVKVNTAFV